MIKNVARIVVENIRTCNLHCKYCFPEQMWDREGRGGQMLEDTYRTIIETVCRNNQRSSIAIDFAGGEPLLAGPKWFDMAFRISQELSVKYNKRFKFSVQTNATLITPKFLDIFKKNKLSIGVSIDGPPSINDSIRGQTNLVLEGIKKIITILGYAPAVIIVISKMNVDSISEVIKFLNELKIQRFRTNLMGGDTPTNNQFLPTASQWVRCQQTVCKEIVAYRGSLMEDHISEKVLKFVKCLLKGISPFEGSYYSCSDVICAAGKTLLYFDSYGNSYPCPRSVTNHNNCIGNPINSNFDEQFIKMNKKLNEEMKLQELCKRCPAQIACDFGCHAWNNGKFFQIVCNSTKELFSWFSNHLDYVAKIYMYKTKELQYMRKLKLTGKISRTNLNELKYGFELSESDIRNLVTVLQERLKIYNARNDLRHELLSQLYPN